MRFFFYFWFTMLAFFFIFFLQGCQSTAPAPMQSNCLFKISASSLLKDGHYRSGMPTQPLGTVSRMEMRVERDKVMLRTVRGDGNDATPETGVDTLTGYEISNGYFLAGSFRADARDVDSVTLKLTWMSREFDLVWWKELATTTGIYPDVRPPEVRTCLE